MKTYFSTFISGFSELIGKELMKNLEGVKIIKLLDGLVLYETSSTPEKVKELKFLNNSFILLFERENMNVNFPDRLIKIVLRDFDFDLLDTIEGKNKTKFRIILSKENELIKVNNDLLKKIEDEISKSKKFVLDRANPEMEFWFLVRNDGLGVFGIRITKHRDYKKVLDKGGLRPELAQILILLSEPKPSDIFLDPFAGSAAIPFARKDFDYKKIIAYDIDPKQNRNNFAVEEGNATNLKNIKDNSIDNIVTDPPWGIFDKNVNLGDLYLKMLIEFTRVLKVNGLLVVLVAGKGLFESILKNFSKQLKPKDQYNILVSGKKAGVYKIIKI